MPSKAILIVEPDAVHRDQLTQLSNHWGRDVRYIHSPADEVNQLFTMFYSSKGRKGTGLGMFITHNVIKKRGGRIEVRSEPEIGTTFLLRLPR